MSNSSSPWEPADEPVEPAPAVPKKHTPTKPSSPTHSESSGRSSNSTMALHGRRVEPEQYANFEEVGDADFYDYPEHITANYDIDYHDLLSINKEIMATRRRLYVATQELKEAQRKEVQAQFEYRHELAQAIISTSGGTEKSRVALSELETEGSYRQYIVAKQAVAEWTNLMRTLKADLDTLAGISHNMRAQMQLQ